MIRRHPISALAVLAVTLICSTHAQQNPGIATAGMSPVLALLFKDFEAFSATAEVTLSGPTAAESMTMTMHLHYLNGGMRTELDMSDVRGPTVDESMAYTLKQIGMNRVITILQPDDRQNVVLYPSRKAYVSLPESSDQEKARARSAQTRKTKQGQEIILGMTCTKSRISFVENPEQDLTVLVWEANRLRNFPVQIEMNQAGGAMTVRYRDVVFEAPAKDQFEIPTGYRKHPGVQSILEEATQELLKPLPKP